MYDPQCEGYGKSKHYPPYTSPVEEIRKMVNEYEYGIFIRLIVPSNQMAGAKAVEEERIGLSRRKLHEIVSKVESQAFYDGYHLAMDFAGGSCKATFCLDIECSALMPGKGCRHPL